MYCPECRNSAGAAKPRSISIFAGLFSVLILFLAGTLIWHGHLGTGNCSWDRLLGRPVATINGEAIEGQYFRAAVTANRRIWECRYGADIFTGKEGRAHLLALQQEILDRMLEERLIAQEAKRLKIIITNEQVEDQWRSMAEEIYGSRENFRKTLTADGMSEAGLKSHIRTILTTRAVMQKKSVSANKRMQPDVSFNAWLAHSKKTAKVVVYDSALMML